mgnify:CR=1 FL=1
MNEITTLNYEGSNVRMIEKDGEPWWVLKDVCAVLELSSPHKVAARLDDDEKGRSLIPTLGGEQEATIISESGLYAVILRSDKPQAKPFRKWVTSEVLPSIRRTGSYTSGIGKESQNCYTQQELTIRELEARAKVADVLYKLLDVDTLSQTYKDILVCKTAEAACGVPVLPLPKSERITLSATEIGKMLGISGQKVGRLANLHGIKTEEYGAWYRDKAAHSSKEVDTFRYFESSVDKFREILQEGTDG